MYKKILFLFLVMAASTVLFSGTAQATTESAPVIAVLSPNGGESWAKGITQTIKWQDESVIGTCVSGEPGTSCVTSKSYDIQLFHYNPPYTGSFPYAIDSLPPTIIAKNIPGFSYDWSVGKTILDTSAHGSGDIAIDGSYTIQICQTGTAICDSSDSYFKITSNASVNNKPIINVFPAIPTGIKVSELVSFGWGATDADADDLAWLTEWGDGTAGEGTPCAEPHQQNKQGQTFNMFHAWSNGGIYTVKTTANDCRGGSNEHIFNVIISLEASSTHPVLKADLQVNNSDSPQAIPYGSKFTASWISSGASYCTGYGNDIIATDGSIWGDRTRYPASGSKTLYAKSASGSVPFSTFHLGLQCWDDFGNSITDLIENIPVALPTTGVVSIKDGSLVKIQGVPDIYFIKDGQKVKINSPKEFDEKGYKWDKIQTVQADLLAQIAELKAQIAQLREELKKTGTLLKAQGGADVYVVKDGKRVKINSPEEFNQKGYKWDKIQEVSAGELSQIPTLTAETASTAPAVSNYPNGALIKAVDGNDIYVIINGKKRRIPDPATFNKFGYKWDQIKKVAGDELLKISDDTTVSIPAVPQAIPASSQGVGTGFLVKSIDNPTVYYITPTGMKKSIPSIEVFNSYPENRFENVKIVPQSQIDGYPTANLFKQNSDAKVYFIEDGKKKWVKTEAAFTKRGFDFGKVSSVNGIELDAYLDGEVIE